jgi:hypothetical protein
MTPSAQIAGGRQVRRWSRETIIEKIREWNDRYGEPPCSADWNPSLARWRAQEWRAERYREGDWPSTNAAKRPFDGSFDAAVRAAGLAPHRAGPRRRAAREALPDFPQRAPQGPRDIADELAVAAERVRAAETRAAALERRLRNLERRAERAEQVAGEARRRARRASEREGRARRARDRVQVAERQVRALTTERVEELVADADARVRAAVDQAEAATRDVYEERRTRQRAETRAAEAELRAEAAERIATAREEVASDAALNAARAAERRAPAAASGGASARRGPAAEPGGASEHAELASNGSVAAWKAARAAEDRAAAAERRARELAVLVCGEPRRLTACELAALRAGGPSGPAVLAAALRDLARARASGNGAALDAALAALASAAVRWRDRL